MGSGRVARTAAQNTQQLARGHALSEAYLDPIEPGWTVTRLDRCVAIVVGPTPTSAIDDHVDRIWAEALVERPALFDGRVFVADDIVPGRIAGYWTDYRYLYAQLRQPGLFPRPHLTALAVNGLLRCAEGAVLGRRRADAVYRPACWQGVPAGSVEARSDNSILTIDDQLLSELEEEIGLTPADITAVTPLVAMEHPNGRVVDIGCSVTTALPFAVIERRWQKHGNDEYKALRCVDDDLIGRLLQEPGPDVLVSARILMEAVLLRRGV